MSDDDIMKLHPRYEVAVPPGSYTLTLTPDIDSVQVADGGSTVPSVSDVPARSVRIDVEGPQFSMGPSELFGAFPPANSIGPFSGRLAQAVLRRKTLPWERSPQDEPDLPWLALVVLGEGEATLLTDVDPVDAYTSGSAPATVRALPTGQGGATALQVSSTVIERTFPARSELPLLVHGREVPLGATEQGSSAHADEDGAVAVVLSNRLPLPGKAYGAFLISLEGQWAALRETGGPVQSKVDLQHSYGDVMEINDIPRLQAFGSNVSGTVTEPFANSARRLRARTMETQQSTTFMSVAVPFDVDWATLFGILGTVSEETVHTFPVLAHWSFTCDDLGRDFAGYMKGLDSALVGTARPSEEEPDRVRPIQMPTGHMQMPHVDRRGQAIKSWYRGPLAPVKITRNVDRSIAHISDQLVKAVAEGSFDVSLASAFEIGRLLAMSDPTFIRNMRAWARRNFVTEKLDQTLEGPFADHLEQLIGDLDHLMVLPDVPGLIVDDLFGGVQPDPWPDDYLDRFMTDIVPSVPIHEAVSLLDDVDVDVIAAGLDLPPDYVTAMTEGDFVADGVAEVAVPEQRDWVTFDDLLGDPGVGFDDVLFDRIHGVALERRVEALEFFGALHQAGVAIDQGAGALLRPAEPGLPAQTVFDASVLAGIKQSGLIDLNLLQPDRGVLRRGTFTDRPPDGRPAPRRGGER